MSSMLKLSIISVVFLIGCSAANQPGADQGPTTRPQETTDPVGSGPTPRPGERVVAWTEDLQRQPGFALYFRNVSNLPVRISSLTLYECLNITGDCNAIDPGILLQPGEVRRARTIEPADARKPFSYRYRYQWTPAGSN